MHLADAFIQSDLQCIQIIHFFVSTCCLYIYNHFIFHFFILFSYPSYIYNYIHFIFAVLALLFTMLCFSWLILFDYIFF